MPNVDQEYCVNWVPHPSGMFFIKSAWEAIRHKNSIQEWHGVVWNGKHVPRWAFIICLAVQQRLSNFDRLVSCGMSVNDDCKLCGRGRESHQYLFFECSYSRSIWQKVRFKCSMPASFQALGCSGALLTGMLVM